MATFEEVELSAPPASPASSHHRHDLHLRKVHPCSRHARRTRAGGAAPTGFFRLVEGSSLSIRRTLTPHVPSLMKPG